MRFLFSSLYHTRSTFIFPIAEFATPNAGALPTIALLRYLPVFIILFFGVFELSYAQLVPPVLDPTGRSGEPPPLEEEKKPKTFIAILAVLLLTMMLAASTRDVPERSETAVATRRPRRC